MTQPTPTRSLIFERIFAHPPETVWLALTDGQLLSRWMMSNDFQPIIGHRFQFRAEPQQAWDGITSGEVLAIKPFEQLIYTCNTSRQGETNTLESTVTWTLETVEGGTLLRMEQSGFRATEVRARDGANQAWTGFLDNLERLLNQPLQPTITQ
jgi:uncharacterized protein YndB with AHSA1/START domain